MSNSPTSRRAEDIVARVKEAVAQSRETRAAAARSVARAHALLSGLERRVARPARLRRHEHD